MQNIPTFAKRENPIKLAIINWIEAQYQRSSESVFVFRMGDLEQGIKESLGKPNLSHATIRTHTSNLTSAKPRFVDEVEPPHDLVELNGETVRKQKTPQQDRCFSICPEQLERLQNIRANWIANRMPDQAVQR